MKRVALTLAAAALLGACGGEQPDRLVQMAAASPTDTLIARNQALLRTAPNDATAMAALAAAYLQKVREAGDPAYYPKAEGLLGSALKLRPDDGEALVQMGALSLGRHRFRDALDWGRRAVALDPYGVRALGVAGDAEVELGRYDEAFATFQRMVDLRPDLSSYARVSYARELTGDGDGAIEAMRAAIAAGGPAPENVAYTQVLLATSTSTAAHSIRPTWPTARRRPASPATCPPRRVWRASWPPGVATARPPRSTGGPST